MRATIWAGLLIAVALTLPAVTARAQLLTCVEIEAAPGPTDTLVRLVRDEIDRHPPHRAATSGCQAYLSIEVLDFGAGGQRFTGRLDTQVPHRERIGFDWLSTEFESILMVGRV